MSIDVIIKMRPGVEDFSFGWDSSSDEARNLWEECEAMADEQGRDALAIAGAVIQGLYDHGEPQGEVAQRGLRVWVIYAVLRFAADRVDLADRVDHAGVLAEPPTVFDLAEHQQIKANVQLVKPGRLAVQITGRSMLDS